MDMDMVVAGDTLRFLRLREDDSILQCIVCESTYCDSERASEGERLRIEGPGMLWSTPRSRLSFRRSSASLSSSAGPESGTERRSED